MKLAALIIAGTRTIEEELSVGIIELAMDKLGWEPQVVICGGAAGPDEAGRGWARRRGITVRMEYATWQVHGKMAGPLRNTRMADIATEEAKRLGLPSGLLALWDGASKGTADMVEKGHARSLEVRVVTITGGQPDASLDDLGGPA